MDKKSLVTVMVCGVLVAMIFGAFLLGSTISYQKGYQKGYDLGISRIPAHLGDYQPPAQNSTANGTG